MRNSLWKIRKTARQISHLVKLLNSEDTLFLFSLRQSETAGPEPNNQTDSCFHHLTK